MAYFPFSFLSIIMINVNLILRNLLFIFEVCHTHIILILQNTTGLFCNFADSVLICDGYEVYRSIFLPLNAKLFLLATLMVAEGLFGDQWVGSRKPVSSFGGVISYGNLFLSMTFLAFFSC